MPSTLSTGAAAALVVMRVPPWECRDRPQSLAGCGAPRLPCLAPADAHTTAHIYAVKSEIRFPCRARSAPASSHPFSTGHIPFLSFVRALPAPCRPPAHQAAALWAEEPGPRPCPAVFGRRVKDFRSEEHTSELQSLMRISYAVFCL